MQRASRISLNMPKFYYKGGFKEQMTRVEAGQILGVRCVIPFGISVYSYEDIKPKLTGKKNR